LLRGDGNNREKIHRLIIRLTIWRKRFLRLNLRVSKSGARFVWRSPDHGSRLFLHSDPGSFGLPAGIVASTIQKNIAAIRILDCIYYKYQFKIASTIAVI
jgi:hypothetical protein